MPGVFRVDEYFTFINFQFYVIQNESLNNFLMLYGVISGLLIFLICFMFGLSGRVFDLSKNEDSKEEGSRIILKALSLLLTLYLYILQIPLTTLLLQGYICDESSDEMLSITDLKCSSVTHNILIITSTLMLIIYSIFLFCE